MLEPGSCSEHKGDVYCSACYGRKFGPKGYGFGGGANNVLSSDTPAKNRLMGPRKTSTTMNITEEMNGELMQAHTNGHLSPGSSGPVSPRSETLSPMSDRSESPIPEAMRELNKFFIDTDNSKVYRAKPVSVQPAIVASGLTGMSHGPVYGSKKVYPAVKPTVKTNSWVDDHTRPVDDLTKSLSKTNLYDEKKPYEREPEYRQPISLEREPSPRYIQNESTYYPAREPIQAYEPAHQSPREGSPRHSPIYRQEEQSLKYPSLDRNASLYMQPPPSEDPMYRQGDYVNPQYNPDESQLYRPSPTGSPAYRPSPTESPMYRPSAVEDLTNSMYRSSPVGDRSSPMSKPNPTEDHVSPMYEQSNPEPSHREESLSCNGYEYTKYKVDNIPPEYYVVRPSSGNVQSHTAHVSDRASPAYGQAQRESPKPAGYVYREPNHTKSYRQTSSPTTRNGPNGQIRQPSSPTTREVPNGHFRQSSSPTTQEVSTGHFRQPSSPTTRDIPNGNFRQPSGGYVEPAPVANGQYNGYIDASSPAKRDMPPISQYNGQNRDISSPIRRDVPPTQYNGQIRDTPYIRRDVPPTQNTAQYQEISSARRDVPPTQYNGQYQDTSSARRDVPPTQYNGQYQDTSAIRRDVPPTQTTTQYQDTSIRRDVPPTQYNGQYQGTSSPMRRDVPPTQYNGQIRDRSSPIRRDVPPTEYSGSSSPAQTRPSPVDVKGVPAPVPQHDISQKGLSSPVNALFNHLGDGPFTSYNTSSYGVPMQQ